jgi:hypothetical protein
MHTLEVTDDQLHLLHESLTSWIKSFSHDQPDQLRAGKELRSKIDAELDQAMTSSFGSPAPTR